MKKFVSTFLSIIILCFSLPINIMATTKRSVFSDINGSEYYANSAIFLESNDIMKGYPDGSFGPQKSVTRSEMAALVCRISGLEHIANAKKGPTSFYDVPETHWASGYIVAAAERNIISGDGNGYFRPEDTVRFEEAVKMVVCALNLAENAVPDLSDWSAPYIRIAEDNGILAYTQGIKGTPETRGDIAVMLYSAINLESKNETVINVKDFGAKGNGIANDRDAIYAAFEYAKNNLPATVYFPEGRYGLLDAMYIELPLGSDGLTVKGDGAEKSTLVFLEEWSCQRGWVAIRIKPKMTPKSFNEYLKNITIRDLGVYDTDPVNHAWTVEKNGAKEETHGFDIQHTINAVIKNCKVDSVGDEAIDMVYCKDSLIENNVVLNSPGAGSAGGAISVGDGCDNVIIRNNIVDGSIIEKTNFGIAVEALIDPVKDIYIYNNTIKNIAGNGINIGAPRGSIENVKVENNMISNCTTGIHAGGTGQKENVCFNDTVITDVKTGIHIDGSNNINTLISNFEISNISDRAIHIKSSKSALFTNGKIKNAGASAIWNAGTDTVFDNIEIDTVGTESITLPAIDQYTKGGSCTLNNVTMKNIHNKIAVRSIKTITNIKISQNETTGVYAIQNATTITGGEINRIVSGLKENGIINGLTIKTETPWGSSAAIYLVNSNCIVRNCNIKIPSGKAISEGGKADYNQVFDNTITGGTLTKLGENSSFYNNTVTNN